MSDSPNMYSVPDESTPESTPAEPPKVLGKVLMIEDDPTLREMYKMKFDYVGFDFQLAGDGQEGLNKMRSFQPDVVLLDLILPVMTGFTVLENIKHDPSINTIPIIVMSNIYADAEELVKNQGVKSFVIKANVSLDEVIEKVKAAIAERATPTV